jgi:serine/threonine protein kinase
VNLQKGTRLGPYEIVAPIGAGGMGEVYRARDTRLNRTVAIKVLASGISAKPELRERFEREARAISSLTHPHICTLHDIGHHDGLDYLVMEFLEGETLAERLSRGALPLDQLLRYAIEIVDALDKAHHQGIVHRDLKPGNVILTKSGAKLLDFGLARYRPVLDEKMSFTALPTEKRPLTAEGTILGTLQYMAPEQLEGKEADSRTDIFAFGALLYEMATGKRAFEGKSKASLIAAILEHDPPPVISLRPVVPAALDRVVRVALAKDPEDRWQTAHDLKVELQWIAEGKAEAAAPMRRAGLAWIPLVVGGAALGMVLAWVGLRATSVEKVSGPTLTHVARLTHDPGHSEWPTWSTESNLFAFGSNRSGNFEIYVRRTDGGQEVNVTNHPAEDIQPAFSPDGKSIAFVSTRSSRTGIIRIGGLYGFEFRTYGGDLWVSPALGGQPRRLAPDANFPIWHPDGRSIAYVSGPENHRSILRVRPEGGSPEPVLASDSSNWEIVRIRYSPGGEWLSFETLDGDLLVLPSKGGKARLLIPGLSHAWDHSRGRLYYLNRDRLGGTRLHYADFDEKTGQIRGEPRTLSVMTGILKEMAVSYDGKHIASSELDGSLNLTRVALRPDGGAAMGPEETLNPGRVIDRYPAFSPDSKRIAFASDRLGPEEIWLMDLESRQLERLQFPGEDLGISIPHWFPDGQRLMVTRFFREGNQFWLIAVDGSRIEQITPVSRELGAYAAISPDGKTLMLEKRLSGFVQLFRFDVETRQERQLTSSPIEKFDTFWSPDGRWLAFTALEGNQYQVRRIPAAGGREEVLISDSERLRHAFYSPDGRWIYVQPSHRNIFRIPATGGRLEQVTHFPESGLFMEEPALSPDGRYLVYCQSNGGSSLWLLTLAENEPSDSASKN